MGGNGSTSKNPVASPSPPSETYTAAGLAAGKKRRERKAAEAAAEAAAAAAKAAAIVAANECGPECQRQKKINKLEEEIKTQTLLHTNTEDTMKKLEANYYELTHGNTEFDTELVNKYKAEINKINAPKQKEMETIKKMYDTLVVKYDQDGIVIERLNQLLQELQTKNDALKNDVNNYYKITNTSARKVYYEKNEIDNLNTYYSVLLVTYYILFVLYLISKPIIDKF